MKLDITTYKNTFTITDTDTGEQGTFKVMTRAQGIVAKTIKDVVNLVYNHNNGYVVFKDFEELADELDLRGCQ
ncbi:hypothetical protein JCM19236_5775 [Vibrio sp. JCM 19236]|nr:hypothetical protein JCM19236_5775 [Vibrio sp. JCM 19236]